MVNREILGDLGIYARYNDYKSLALRIEDLLDNDGLRKELKEKLRENALDHSWEKSAMDIVKIYNKCIGIANVKNHGINTRSGG